MLFRQLKFLLFLLLFPFGKDIHAQSYSKLEKKMVRSIYKDSGIDVQRVPNLLLIYSHKGTEGQILLDFNKKDSITLDPDKLVALGDASQFLAAQSILQLIEENRLQLSTDVNHFLPQGYRNPTPITIESLLSHQSGFPKIPNNFGKYEKDKNDPYQFYTDTALLEFIHDYPLSQKKDTYRYSLVNYALLQYILKGFGQKPALHTKKANQGHKEGHPVTPQSYYQFASAKGLQMTPNALFDLLKKIKNQTRDYPTFPTKLDKKTYSSYGFHVLHQKRQEIGLLMGAVNGFTVIAAFDRKRDRIMVIVTDSQDYSGRLFHALSWFFR